MDHVHCQKHYFCSDITYNANKSQSISKFLQDQIQGTNSLQNDKKLCLPHHNTLYHAGNERPRAILFHKAQCNLERDNWDLISKTLSQVLTSSCLLLMASSASICSSSNIVTPGHAIGATPLGRPHGIFGFVRKPSRYLE